jgi:hypothetical protein
MGTPLDAPLADLGPTPVVATLVEDLTTQRSLAADRRSNYLSLRPVPLGAIAVYVHRDRISVAMDPAKATRDITSVPGAKAQHRTPATTYVVIDADTISASYPAVLRWVVEAIDWRASGPQSTVGKGRSRSNSAERPICPNGWMEITPSGSCGCGCG